MGGQRDGAPSPVKWLLVAVVAACGGCSAAYHPTDGANKMKMGKQFLKVLGISKWYVSRMRSTLY